MNLALKSLSTQKWHIHLYAVVPMIQIFSPLFILVGKVKLNPQKDEEEEIVLHVLFSFLLCLFTV